MDKSNTIIRDGRVNLKFESTELELTVDDDVVAPEFELTSQLTRNTSMACLTALCSGRHKVRSWAVRFDRDEVFLIVHDFGPDTGEVKNFLGNCKLLR